MEPKVHMLSTMDKLKPKQLEAIMDILECNKCVSDSKRNIYYFLNKDVRDAD